MSLRAEIREGEDRLLVELTDLAMGLARDMAGRAKQADSLEDAERLTLAFDRMSRSVRLSIGLRRRLERDDVREDAARRAEVVDLKTAKLRARLRTEIRESEVSFRVRCELERELDGRLAEEALYQTFLDLPVDEAVTKLRQDLGLDASDPPPQCGGGGPPAEEPGVEGASRKRRAPAAPSVLRSEFTLRPVSDRTGGARSTSPVVFATREEREAPS